MARKAPSCRSCGKPMKGHSKSGCLIPKLQPTTPSTEPRDDGTSIISSTPSFIIPETGPFRRQNPNYVLPSPAKVQTLPLSSASLTPTELVPSVKEMKRSFPAIQQFTPNWSRPSSPQPSRRVVKQQPSLVLDSPSVALSPTSVFGDQLGDSVRLVAGIYELPSTATEPFCDRALSNGIYCVPVEPLRGNASQVSGERMQSTWIVTGPMFADVDALTAVLHPRSWISQIRLTEILQVVRDMDALCHGALALLLLCTFVFVFGW